MLFKYRMRRVMKVIKTLYSARTRSNAQVLNNAPSLQKARIRACRKDARNRYRPLPQVAQIPVVILRGAGAMSCQGIKGDGRVA